MNILVFIVACFTLLAFIAHLFGGTKETAELSPCKQDREMVDKKILLTWKQAMCAFQMLAVDLLLVAVTLFTVALTDIFPFEYELILFLSGVFFLWGVVWLIQLFWLKSDIKSYLILPQWLLWFGCSGLLYWGA